MKLLRHGPPGAEKPGLLDDGRIRDLSGVIDDLMPEALTAEGLTRLKALDPGELPAVGGAPRLGPPVAGVGKIVAAGLNYTDHAEEAGLPLPEEPLLFMKATTSLAGPDDPVTVPRGAEKVDWEVELAVVIGARAKNVGEEEALDHVAGYAVLNDLCERAWQFELGGQWVKGKSHDGFCPLGPWLVTADEVPDPQALPLWLEVNGERRQDGNTRDMVFGVRELVSYISRFMTLMPGDVIATGTPAGVGLGRQRFLKVGDVVRLGVEGLGEQRQQMVTASGG